MADAETIETERQAQAVKLAVDAAKREAHVDQTLEDHARELDDLGETVRANTSDLRLLSGGQASLQSTVDDFSDARKTREQKKLSRRATAGWLVGVLIAFGSFLVPLLQALHL